MRHMRSHFSTLLQVYEMPHMSSHFRLESYETIVIFMHWKIMHCRVYVLIGFCLWWGVQKLLIKCVKNMTLFFFCQNLTKMFLGIGNDIRRLFQFGIEEIDKFHAILGNIIPVRNKIINKKNTVTWPSYITQRQPG